MLSAARPDITEGLDYWPPFLYSIGFLVIGGIATLLSTLGVAALAVLRKTDGEEEPSPGPVTIAVFNVLGLIPAFMYGSWLGQQIRELVA